MCAHIVIYIYRYISSPAPKYSFVSGGAYSGISDIIRLKQWFRGGNQNCIVGVPLDRANMDTAFAPMFFFPMHCPDCFWYLFIFYVVFITLIFVKQWTYLSLNVLQFFLTSLKHGFWYFYMFSYYLLSHQLPPPDMVIVARIAAPAKALPAAAATPSASSSAVGLLFPGQGSQYAAGQWKELAWDGNNGNNILELNHFRMRHGETWVHSIQKGTQVANYVLPFWLSKNREIIKKLRAQGRRWTAFGRSPGEIQGLCLKMRFTPNIPQKMVGMIEIVEWNGRSLFSDETRCSMQEDTGMISDSKAQGFDHLIIWTTREARCISLGGMKLHGNEPDRTRWGHQKVTAPSLVLMQVSVRSHSLVKQSRWVSRPG